MGRIRAWLPSELAFEARHALRALAARPRHLTLCVLLLGLGLGANIAVLSVLRGVLYEDLPYRDSDRLALLWAKQQSSGDTRILISYFDFLDMGKALPSAEDTAALRVQGVALTSLEEPIAVSAARVTPNLLSLLGVRVLAGRDLAADDARPGAAPVALVSERLCKEHLGGGRCDLRGRTLTLDGLAHEIVGVVPEAVELERMRGTTLEPFDVWVPLVPRPDELTRRMGYFWVFARLAPGATVAGLGAELDAYFDRRAEEDPATFGGASGEVQPVRDALAGPLQKPMMIALSASLLLLLTAALGFTSLVVVRHLEELGPTAIRRVLGATPRAILRATLCEVLIIVIAGFAGAALFAFATLRVLQSLGARAGLAPEALSLQASALAVAAVAAAGVVVLSSLLVTRKLSRMPLAPCLKGAGKGEVGNRARTLPMSAMVVVQIAVGIGVLSLGGFLYAQLARARAADPGFSAAGLWAIALTLPQSRYPDDPSRLALLQGLEDDLRQAGGVEGAGVVWRSAPGLPGLAGLNVTPEGFDGRLADLPLVHYRVVTPEYLSVIGAELIAGRNFEFSDIVQASDSVVVSAPLAGLFWPGDTAVGKRLRLFGDDEPLRTVVGVVGDMRLTALDEPAEKAVFIPMSQNRWKEFLGSATLVVRSGLDDADLRRLARETLQARDPDLPIRRMARIDEALQGTLAKREFVSALILAFALMTAIVVVLGIYGQFAQASARRLREFAVRRVLGATASRVLGDALKGAALLCAAGAVAGAFISGGVARLGRSFLLDAAPSDLAVSVVGGLLVVAAALIAAAVPVTKAVRQPIASVLRAQP